MRNCNNKLTQDISLPSVSPLVTIKDSFSAFACMDENILWETSSASKCRWEGCIHEVRWSRYHHMDNGDRPACNDHVSLAPACNGVVFLPHTSGATPSDRYI